MDMDTEVSPPICTKTIKHLIPVGISLRSSKSSSFWGVYDYKDIKQCSS